MGVHHVFPGIEVHTQMLFWIIIAAITAITALLVLAPLSRDHTRQNDNQTEEAGLYQAQLKDISRDVSRGVLGHAEAEGLRVEAARRLLRTDRETLSVHPETEVALFRRRAAALVIAIALPLGGGLSYLKLGSPGLPDQPLHARAAASPEQIDVLAALERIERHLASSPGDVRGWDLVAPIYLRLGRPLDAARAYQAAINNGAANAERWAALGGARMVAAGGMITVEARLAFDEALKLEPRLPKALYGLAMGKQQDGDVTGAMSDLESLISEAPADAPYVALLRQSLATMRGVPQGGGEIANLSADDRNAAIGAMVDGLAERLKSGGGTIDDWQRLIRARMVLGDKVAAEAALATARTRLGVDAAAMEALGSLAREFKLENKP